MLRTPFVLLILVTASGCTGEEAFTLDHATRALRSNEARTIEYSGTGRGYQFSQAPSAGGPWPAFDVSHFAAALNYETPAARVEMTRLQVVDPNRARPTPAQQRPVQLVSGGRAWNMVAPPGAAPDAPAVPQPQPEAVEERTMEIWTTPHGFLRAAAANNATIQPAGTGNEVSFTMAGRRYVGHINAQNHVERVQTWIDNTVMGDTPVEVEYSEYREFGEAMFPERIVRRQGGHPVLELTVSAMTLNPAVAIPVPEQVASFTPPEVNVTVEKLANGVYYIKGGSHHSIAIDQADHIVVVEGPQNEARSVAVIARVKETIPNKPIRYMVNTHVHFDHSGGLRTYVAEGATIVTHASNEAFYKQAWSAPRTLNADLMAKAGKAPTFETFTDKHTLTDGRRAIEVHLIAGSGHNDGFAMIYLPAEKILAEVDAWAPLAPGAQPPATPSPVAVNLLENIDRLKLDVRQIAALHGPRLAPIAELRAAVGSRSPAR